MATTLSDLMFLVRSEGDELTSDFVLDDELLIYINNSYRRLNIELVTRGIYELNNVDVTVSGTDTGFDVPSDFYKAKGLEVTSGGTSWTVPNSEFRQRNDKNPPWRFPYGVPLVTWRLQSDRIEIVPSTHAGGTYRFWYHPEVIPLVEPTDIISRWIDGTGYHEFIAIDAAIKLKTKGDYPVDSLLIRRQDILASIQADAYKRNMARSVTMTDSFARSSQRW